MFCQNSSPSTCEALQGSCSTCLGSPHASPSLLIAKRKRYPLCSPLNNTGKNCFFAVSAEVFSSVCEIRTIARIAWTCYSYRFHFFTHYGRKRHHFLVTLTDGLLIFNNSSEKRFKRTYVCINTVVLDRRESPREMECHARVATTDVFRGHPVFCRSPQKNASTKLYCSQTRL